MQTLLDKIGIIDYKYEKLHQHNSFNIFTILRKKTDEVNLHSNFIAELLDPEGSHGLLKVFLDLFLNEVGIDASEFVDAYVHKEYRNIDILIESKERVIILENKIWAGDQEKQLERYYDTLLEEGKRNIKIVYLTLNGTEPSDYSLGVLKAREELPELLTLISYKEHIRSWLVQCIKEAALIPTLRETLIQYKNLVDDLTGNSMSKEEMMEVVDLLSQNNNVLLAKKIVDHWVDIQWHAEWYFWQDLEKVIEKEYPILPLQKYSPEYLNGSIHRSRNKDPFYGIMFSIKKLGTDEVCIYVEKGEIDNLYYGVTIVRDRYNRGASDDSIYDALAKKLDEISDWDREENWIAGNHFKVPINFERFEDDETVKLLNPEYRGRYIQNLWEDIKAYIKDAELESFELPLKKV